MAPKKSGQGKSNASKRVDPAVPGSDYIVFGDDSGGSKKKKEKSRETSQAETVGPPQPTVKQIIGGASWTGKLPVNLLSELCQRQKWNKPDYSMRQTSAKDGGEKMHRSDVTLSKTDPKTREMTKLAPIKLPQEHAHLADQATALEARHFAATYALFRLQSTRSIHMTLPPLYKDLWKGSFSQLKKEEVEQGQGWKYDEDPFAAEVKRQEIRRAIEKRDAEKKKRQEEEAKAIADGNPLRTRAGPDQKAWERAPKAEMGSQIRADIEKIVRRTAVWNHHGLKQSSAERAAAITEVAKLGFRHSHVEEASSICKNREEMLEWLMIHVPEDDLPRWALPPMYSAGVTLASGDLVKEAKIKKLGLSGYSLDASIEALRDCDGDESLAAEALQNGLVPKTKVGDRDTICNTDTWSEEMVALESIYAEKFTVVSANECTLSATAVDDTAFIIRFRCPSRGYPQSNVPMICVEIEKSPAYVRLSATRHTILYAYQNLLGEAMIYSIVQWLEAELPNIVQNPGRLCELRPVLDSDRMTAYNSTDMKGKTSGTLPIRKPREQDHRPRDRQSNQQVLDALKAREMTPEQVKMNLNRQGLPAWLKKDEIIDAVTNRQITIVSGETGSGKSTQVVQFLLDNAIAQMRGATTNIICTQPRRVATLSLADRVSSERCSNVGDEVGYIIRGDSKTSAKTKITFMTTGVLLRRLQSSNSIKEGLSDISHVFIDEVHERSLDTDFLLALLREYTKIDPNVKVVLMSATLDAEIFTTYFGGPQKVGLVHIEGRTFPVQDLYLDDVLKLTNYSDFNFAQDENGADGDEQASVQVRKAVQNLGSGINYDLIRELVMCIDSELGSSAGAILIFLPGTMEIERCLRAIRNLPGVVGLPLHASLLPAEQRKVFPPQPAGKRKVIAATNVAETSITIEDIVAVIDTGRVKETSYDPTNNIVRLQEVWASQAACKQRRGRAGRVRAGVCYKMFTRNVELKMPPKNLPEILRVSLEQLCLSIKATGANRDVAMFLSQTLTPPAAGAIGNAVKNLHTIGALEDNRLTALGTYMSMIPADLRCAKLLVYGVLFGCLESCLTIAAILTVKSPFVSPKDKREEASEARRQFNSSHGDLLLDMEAFNEWEEVSSRARSREVQDWCSSNFLSAQTLRDIASTRRQMLDSLKDIGLIPLDHRTQNSEMMVDATHQALLLRALIAGALQPQIALIDFPLKKYIASVSGAKELDPEAKTIKFFIRDESDIPHDDGQEHTMRSRLSRVFIHPSSALFTAQTYSHHASHLAYFGKMLTSKAFIRDLTPLNIYSLLLFGGKLELDTAGQGLIVGGVFKVRGWARIGVLINRLRTLLDDELGNHIDGGGMLLHSMKGSEVVKIVKRLVELNGQDQ